MKELTQTYKAKIRHTLQLYTMKGRIPDRLRFMRLRSLEFLGNFVLDFEMYEGHQQERVN